MYNNWTKWIYIQFEFVMKMSHLFELDADGLTKGNLNLDPDFELPEIFEILTKLESEAITDIKAHELASALSQSGTQTKQYITNLIHTISFKIYQKHEVEIANITDNLDKCLIEKTKISTCTENNPKKYIGLFNSYQLISRLESTPPDSSYKIPLAVNALLLTGKLYAHKGTQGIDFNKAAIALEFLGNKKIPITRGIKDSRTIYVYKFVKKIQTDYDKPSSYLATNKRGQRFFIRRIKKAYLPHAVLASKIATLIMPGYFASERLLDNGSIASKELPSYISTVDPKIKSELQDHILNQNMLRGTGIIEEVNNFIGEEDHNMENFGVSSLQLKDNPHLTKIDFDFCSFKYKRAAGSYEENLLTEHRRSIYRYWRDVSDSQDYIKEILSTRLKLSMLPVPLFEELAKKAYATENYEDEKTTIEVCVHRRDIAFQLFIEHKSAKDFLQQNLSILNQSYNEIVIYIKNHFDEANQEIILKSLIEKVRFIHTSVMTDLGIRLELPIEASLEDQAQDDLVNDTNLATYENINNQLPNNSELLIKENTNILDIGYLVKDTNLPTYSDINEQPKRNSDLHIVENIENQDKSNLVIAPSLPIDENTFVIPELHLNLLMEEKNKEQTKINLDLRGDDNLEVLHSLLLQFTDASKKLSDVLGSAEYQDRNYQEYRDFLAHITSSAGATHQFFNSLKTHIVECSRLAKKAPNSTLSKILYGIAALCLMIFIGVLLPPKISGLPTAITTHSFTIGIISVITTSLTSMLALMKRETSLQKSIYVFFSRLDDYSRKYKEANLNTRQTQEPNDLAIDENKIPVYNH